MSRIYNWFHHEWIVQNRIYNIVKYYILFFSFLLIIAAVINHPQEIQRFGTIFCIMYIPLSFFGMSHSLIAKDLEDGSLDIIMTTGSVFEMMLSKLLVLITSSSLGFIITLPLIMLFFHLELQNAILLMIVAVNLVIISASLILLVSAIQSYFKENTNFLTMIIIPLLVPSISLAGVFVEDFQSYYLLTILLGINLIIAPSSLYMSSYLVQNLYDE